MSEADKAFTKYTFDSKQLFPINTNITTALTLQGDILVVTGTYPPTLNLFNINTYHMIFSRQLDYEIRKIEKINDKLILLSDNYIEFHNMSRFVEKVKTRALDFKYNPIDGRIYSVGNNGIEIMDFIKNIKLSNTSSNRNEQFSKIDISSTSGLGYLINNRSKEDNNLKNSIDIYDFRMSLPNIVVSKNTRGLINSFVIKDPIRFCCLSDGFITEHDLRSSSVIEYRLNHNDLRNLKYIANGLMFNDKDTVFYLNKEELFVPSTEGTITKDYVNTKEVYKTTEEVEDYVLKDGYLYIGGSEGVQILYNEYFSLFK